jgi:hypothetical protein
MSLLQQHWQQKEAVKIEGKQGRKQAEKKTSKRQAKASRKQSFSAGRSRVPDDSQTPEIMYFRDPHTDHDEFG